MEFSQRLIVYKVQIDRFKTKGSLTGEEIKNFVDDLHTFMVENDLRANPNEVCITLNLYIHQNNSPAIQNIPKVYIDLIQKIDSRRNNQIRKERSLISDDKNISILRVNYERSPNMKNFLEFRLYPFSLIRKAINILYRFEHGYYTKSDEYELIDKKEDVHYKHSEIALEVYDGFNELYKKEKDGQLLISDKIHLMYCKLILQKAFYEKQLYNIYFPLDFFYNRIDRYAYKSLKQEILAEEQIGRSSILDSLVKKFQSFGDITSFNFQIRLSENPQKEGESQRFKADVRDHLTDMIHRYPYLKPTYIPLSVLIVMMPGKNQEIDVDNLARKYIIPEMERILQPPTDFLSGLKDDDLRYIFKSKSYRYIENKDVNLEKYFTSNSLSSYECIKLERVRDEEGFVYVCITESSDHLSLVDAISKRLDDYELH
jgi:hypothetical protein